MNQATPPLILFDGVCNFCNGAVNFIIQQDRKKVFRFAPLQSGTGLRLKEQYGLPDSLDSFILVEGGKAYKRSTAGLRIYNKLPWYWKWTQVFWIVPRPLRDAVYNGKLHDPYAGSTEPVCIKYEVRGTK
jgi:predicted DCC family thiol-disulfide oxidoreductase YuxK